MNELKTFLKMSPRFSCGGFLFFAIISISPLFSESSIYLKQRVVLDKEDIRLSDIARLEKGVEDRLLIKGIDRVRVIKPEEINEFLSDTSIRVLGKECMVIPLDKKYTKLEIEESLKAEIIKRSEIDESRFKLSYLGVDEKLPSGGVELKWSNFSRNLGPGQKIFSLDFYADGNKIFSKRLKFLLETEITAVVAVRDIEKRKFLTKEDFELKTFLSPDPVGDGFQKSVDGFTSLAFIPKGSIIRRKQVREIHAVEKGSEVEMYYLGGLVSVKGRAVAKEYGNLGDLIKVTSISGNVPLTARVAERGKVVVE